MFNEQTLLSELKQKIESILESTRDELVVLKTGRASPAMVEGLIVEAYGGTTKMKLLELATITTEGSSSLLIAPFDPSIVQDIERAILSSPLGLTPRVDGKDIHIAISALSQEQRAILLKTVSIKVEEGKSTLRHARDDVRRKVKTSFETKDVTEDQKFRVEKEIDKIASDYTGQLDTMKEKKEREIMGN